MFDFYGSTDDTESPPPVDYTGLKIGLLVAPVFFLFAFLGNADLGLSVCLILGLFMLVIKLRWNFRKHVWFWVTIGIILALHIPLLFVGWPHGNIPRIAFLPLGLLDFLIVMGAIGLAEKLFDRPKE
jgi:hypothetical protein